MPSETELLRILDELRALPVEIESLLLDKLPDVLNENKIRNLLQKMSRNGELFNAGGRGSAARWKLSS